MLREMPMISIVTPSYNQGRFIEDNIKSVLAQGYPDFEHIIIDGGSTDNTVEILKKYPHLKWVSEPDRGQSHAINKGFKKAKGKIVGWLNSDDCYESGAFESVLKVFRNNPGVGLVYGDLHVVDVNGKIKRKYEGTPYKKYHEYGLVIRGLYGDPVILQQTVFFRKSTINKTGMIDENLHYCMDVDYWIRADLENIGMYYLPITLANFRSHAQSKTVSQQNLPFVVDKVYIHQKLCGGRLSPRHMVFLVAKIYSENSNTVGKNISQIISIAKRKFGIEMDYSLFDTLSINSGVYLRDVSVERMKGNKSKALTNLILGTAIGLIQPSALFREIAGNVISRSRRNK